MQLPHNVIIQTKPSASLARSSAPYSLTAPSTSVTPMRFLTRSLLNRALSMLLLALAVTSGEGFCSGVDKISIGGRGSMVAAFLLMSS
ncbi:hypothetical protein GQ457_14G025340 [Hibiscus cannabinus]